MPKTDIRVSLSEPFNKSVLVAIQTPKFDVEGDNFASRLSKAHVDFHKASTEARIFVESLEVHGKIRDLEAGVNPKGATHEVVKDSKGDYRLKRFRFA